MTTAAQDRVLSNRTLSDRRLRRRLIDDEAALGGGGAAAAATLYSSWSTADVDYPTGLKVVDFGGVAGEVINQSGFVLKDAQAALGAAGNGVQVPKAGIYRLTYSAVANPNQVVAAPQFILISYMVPSWTGTPSPTQQSETNPLPPIPSGEDFGPLLEDSFIWPVPAGGGFAVAAFNLGSGTVTLSGQGARIEIEKLSD